jgi:Protein of unknown function (DUF4238)
VYAIAPPNQSGNEEDLIVALPAKGAAARKHHYVPQFYLRGFVGEKDMLLVFDRETKEPYRSKPHGVAAQRDFNRIEVEGMDASAVELLLSEFEGETAPRLGKVIADKSISDEKNKAAIVNLMAAMTMRNPKRRKAMGKVVENFTRSFLGKKENFDAYVADNEKQGKEGNLTIEDVRNGLAGMDLTPSKESIMAAEIDHHDQAAERLWNKKWQLVIASDDSGGFITTDDLVTIHWTDGQEHADRPGLAENNSEIIFPLSTKLALRGRSDGEEGVVNADVGAVAKVNSQIINNASRQVFAHDHSFKFARGEPVELKSGATLNQDEQFLSAEKPTKSKIVPLRAE